MKKIYYFLLPILALSALPAQAICPICVVAVGAGLGLSEYLGIDNTIAGLWIGGLLISVSVWTITWFNQKNWSLGSKFWRNILTFILFYALTLWPLWAQGLIGYPNETLWGWDKLLLGTTIGTISFVAATMWYNNIKKTRGRAHFPFQKVVMPVSTLLILSGLFYFITK
ncbi:hypothetical protein AUJ26_03160 [Candidatus Falkowbacteria bacterium CG1_02_37_21]|nr:MAG: hypothetical protein AUJ26_03160 [Candidatus Falkowbacteria bacterium CG1_02_37_21]